MMILIVNYPSGRTDHDENYYTLGNINYYDGLNSFVFEIDPKLISCLPRRKYFSSW